MWTIPYPGTVMHAHKSSFYSRLRGITVEFALNPFIFGADATTELALTPGNLNGAFVVIPSRASLASVSTEHSTACVKCAEEDWAKWATNSHSSAVTKVTSYGRHAERASSAATLIALNDDATAEANDARLALAEEECVVLLLDYIGGVLCLHDGLYQ